jgi:O-antigen/teichoic acid export membrane protein
VYNIAFFMAMVPHVLCTAFNNKIIQPLYRMKPIQNNDKNRANVFKARRLVIGMPLVASVLLAFSGIFLVDLMYDDRFALAGPIIVLISFALVPRLTFLGYNGVLLAVGDSGKFFVLNLLTGVLQLVLMLAGAFWFGIFGVVVAPALASLLSHPLRVYWVRPYRGWDKWADFGFLVVGFALTGLACWLYWDQIVVLAG